MSCPWNDSLLLPPPVTSVRTRIDNKKIAEIKDILHDGIATMMKSRALDLEGAMLSRYLFRTRRTLRHDKGIKLMAQIMKDLRSYLKIDLLNLFINFREILPTKQTGEIFVNLPTQQMLKFILLRLQTHSKLCVRIINISEKCSSSILNRARLGWNSEKLLLAVSIVSRIWQISKHLLNKTIEWYNKLHVYLDCFKSTALFVEDYVFVSDLTSWLGEDAVIDKRLKKSLFDDIFIVLSSDDEDVDATIVLDDLKSNFDDCSIVDVVPTTVELKEPDCVIVEQKRKLAQDDIGVSVDRNVVQRKKKKRRQELN